MNKAWHFYISMALFLFVFSCKKENVERSRDIVLHDNVKVVSDDYIIHLADMGEDYIIFDDAHPFFSEVQVGDVLVTSESSDLAPGGFLLRVEDIAYEKSGRYTYFTSPATLIDLIESGVIDDSFDPIVLEYPEGDEPLSAILFDGDGNNFTEHDQLTADWKARFELNIERFYMDFREDDVKATIDIRVDALGDITCLSGELSQTISPDELEYDITPEIPRLLLNIPAVRGLTALPIDLNMSLNIGISGKIDANIEYGHRIDGTYKQTISYDDDWRFSKPEYSFEHEQYGSLSGNVSFELYARPEIAMDFFKTRFNDELADLAFHVKPYLRAEYNTEETLPCGLYSGLDFGYTAGLFLLEDDFESDGITIVPPYPIIECEQEGLFKVYQLNWSSDGGSFALSSSLDGQTVAVMNNCELHVWNQSEDQFSIVFNCFDIAPYFESEYAVFLNIAVHPHTKAIYMDGHPSHLGNYVPEANKILKWENGEFEVIADNFSPVYIQGMYFDAVGDLWLLSEDYEEGYETILKIDGNTNVPSVIQQYEEHSISNFSRAQDRQSFLFYHDSQLLSIDLNGNISTALETTSTYNTAPPYYKDLNQNIWSHSSQNDAIVKTHLSSQEVTTYPNDSLGSFAQIFIDQNADIWNINSVTADPFINLPQIILMDEANTSYLSHHNTNIPDPFSLGGNGAFIWHTDYNHNTNQSWYGYGNFILRYDH